MVPDQVYEMLLSGVGLGAYVLYNRIPAGADPLGQENILGFVSGLLTGTPSMVTGRWMVVCKSPLTGGWGDANCGGNLSPAIKKCGYDGIFFSGISKEPVYLYVGDQGAELRSATHVWGQDAITAEETLIQENTKKKKPAVAVIGTSGEKLSLISGVCNDGGRIAARSGVGAVMGSKRLKAVVLAGTKPIGCQDPKAMKAISKEMADLVNKKNIFDLVPGSLLPVLSKVLAGMKKAGPMDGITSTMLMKRWGTIMTNMLGAVNGDTPIKNWSGSVKDFPRSHYKNLNPDLILKTEVRKYHCYSCNIGCGGIVDASKATKGEFGHTHKPEYETCAVFGSLLLNKDLDSIYYINELLNRAGMDIISAGGTVAFAIECYEKGLINREMTDGLELTWGNSEAIILLVKKMIARDGIGDLLADGSKVAATKLGVLNDPVFVTAGGQEPGMHDPRMDPILGIHFSADPTPGRHTIGGAQYFNQSSLWEQVSWVPNPGSYLKSEEYIPTEKLALKSVANSCYKELTDGAGGCLFSMMMGINNWKIFEWLNAATGWEKTPDEYMEIGKRIQTMRQLFNVKHGIDPISFKMSARIAGTPPLQEGPNKGKTVPIEEMMHLHWKVFGWDENTGVPTATTISQLSLNTLIEQPHFVK